MTFQSQSSAHSIVDVSVRIKHSSLYTKGGHTNNSVCPGTFYDYDLVMGQASGWCI